MSGVESKLRAKRIIIEIIRQGGGQLDGHTRLFKAFYFAHLYYFQHNPGLLSDWPIVHMPNGPGIETGRELIEELVSAGVVVKEVIYEGPYESARFRLVGNPPTCLDENEVKSIRDAVSFVKGKSATELSDLLHEHSRSWNNGRSGRPLNIYIDILEDARYDAEMDRMGRLREEIASVFRD